MTAPWETAPVGRAAAAARTVAQAIPRLETARLALRPPKMTDFDAFAAILTGPRATFIGGATERDEALAAFLAGVGGWGLRGHGLWSVDTRTDSTLIGFVLLDHEIGDLEPELGYLFTEQAEGQGYATEAAIAARGFAREALGWTTVVSYIDPDNARSIRVAEKLGAKPDADLFEGCLVYRHDLARGAA